MHDFLTECLGVPDSNIRLLLSPSSHNATHVACAPATRATIMSSLYEHFRDNASISKRDNLLLYFAGHGTRYGLDDLEQVEALCPVDRGQNRGTDMVADISVHEIITLIQELSVTKSSHITVFLDCGYWGSTARDLDDLGQARGLLPLPGVSAQALLRAANEDLQSKGVTATTIDRMEKWDTARCAVFVSCSATEVAWERQFDDTTHTYRGLFTHALLDVLASDEGSGSTYLEICTATAEHIPKYRDLPVQTPSVLGAYINRTLWYASNGGISRQPIGPLSSSSPPRTEPNAPGEAEVTARIPLIIFEVPFADRRRHRRQRGSLNRANTTSRHNQDGARLAYIHLASIHYRRKSRPESERERATLAMTKTTMAASCRRNVGHLKSRRTTSRSVRCSVMPGVCKGSLLPLRIGLRKDPMYVGFYRVPPSALKVSSLRASASTPALLGRYCRH